MSTSDTGCVVSVTPSVVAMRPAKPCGVCADRGNMSTSPTAHDEVVWELAVKTSVPLPSGLSVADASVAATLGST